VELQGRLEAEAAGNQRDRGQLRSVPVIADFARGETSRFRCYPIRVFHDQAYGIFNTTIRKPISKPVGFHSLGRSC
jgi:hypothetical protein